MRVFRRCGPLALAMFALVACAGVSSRPKAPPWKATARPVTPVVVPTTKSPEPPAPPVAARPVFDLNLIGEDAPLDVVFSPEGHVLFASKRTLFDWDPSGGARTRSYDLRKMHGASILQGEVHARFSADGSHLLLHAVDEDFEVKASFRRQKFAVVVVRTDTGVETAGFSRVLKLEPPVEYMMVASLSRSGLYLLLEKPYQLEVFDVASGANVLRRTDGGFGDSALSFDETNLLLSRGETLEMVDLSQKKAPRRHANVRKFALSDDQKRVAMYDPRQALRIWDLTRDLVSPGAQLGGSCDLCTLVWHGTDAPTLFRSGHGALEAFRGEGFSVVETYVDGALRPVKVTLTTPKGTEPLALEAAQVLYQASHGRLLINGRLIELVESDGTRIPLAKRN